MSTSNTKEKKYTFSGHESFPCKTLWLKKGYDFLQEGKDFNSPDAVIDLGVGKNMVSSIRFWLKAFGITDADGNSWLGDYLFRDKTGKDLYVDGKRKVTKEIFLYGLLKLKELEGDNTISFDTIQERVGLVFCMQDFETIEMLKQLASEYGDYFA
jgi:hypothetical protein